MSEILKMTFLAQTKATKASDKGEATGVEEGAGRGFRSS